MSASASVKRWWGLLAIGSAILAIGMGFVWWQSRARTGPHSSAGVRRLAVIGNSDSHAYHDSLWFPPGVPQRGGRYRAVTLQWTEVLHRLRSTALDQGVWGSAGTSARLARVAAWFGTHLRSPRKQDFAHNFAYSGARCESVLHPRGQLKPLLRIIAGDTAGWENGVVLIRIGINDIGIRPVLDVVATAGVSDSMQVLVRGCTAAIISASEQILRTVPSMRIVLVGIADNANWPPNFDAFRSRKAMDRIHTLEDTFDVPLREYAARRSEVAFWDDRQWFTRYFGDRDVQGQPGFRSLSIAGLTVTDSQGDELAHAFLADGHAGTVMNALWAQDLVAFLVAEFGASLTPISSLERDSLLLSLQAQARATVQ